MWERMAYSPHSWFDSAAHSEGLHYTGSILEDVDCYAYVHGYRILKGVFMRKFLHKVPCPSNRIAISIPYVNVDRVRNPTLQNLTRGLQLWKCPAVIPYYCYMRNSFIVIVYNEGLPFTEPNCEPFTYTVTGAMRSFPDLFMSGTDGPAEPEQEPKRALDL